MQPSNDHNTLYVKLLLHIYSSCQKNERKNEQIKTKYFVFTLLKRQTRDQLVRVHKIFCTSCAKRNRPHCLEFVGFGEVHSIIHGYDLDKE